MLAGAAFITCIACIAPSLASARAIGHPAAYPGAATTASAAAPGAGPVGYYRQPSLRGDTLVFVSEGDLWKVNVKGGPASRLTSHLGNETDPEISPDGQLVAFSATYEGAGEIYVMPIDGGAPTRLTFDSARSWVSGWTPDGRIIAATDVFSGLPSMQLVLIDPKGAPSPARERIPLAQAADGTYDDTGKTLFFTRLAFQGSHTKRYKGGTAQNLWRFGAGDAEATPLTADYPGTSKEPMWWKGRVYFLTDRDGWMNIWSMNPDGKDLKQHTRHQGWDAAAPSMSNGRIAYQLGADIHVLDVTSGADAAVPITLESDFEQTRERWVPKPAEYITGAHISPDGDKVVITARGRVYVAPAKQGRIVEATHNNGVRNRDARFLPGDGEARLVTLSDQSGEVELWTLPANGVGEPAQLTTDSNILRWEAIPSPDRKLIAHHDKNQRLYVYDVEKKTNTKIDEAAVDVFGDLAWAPDSRWLAYVKPAGNTFRTVVIWSAADNSTHAVTTDRFDSYSPAWSADGKWLYLLSSRNLDSVVESPWGYYQPEPFFDNQSLLYQIALKPGARSPFLPNDEVYAAQKKAEAEKKKQKDKEEKERKEKEGAEAAKPETTKPAEQQPADKKPDEKKPDDKKPDDAGKDKKGAKAGDAVVVEIDFDNIAARISRVPVPAGNYTALAANEKALFWLSTPSAAGERKSALQAVVIANEDIEVKTVAADLKGYELSQDGKKLLLRKDGGALFIVDAAAAPATLEKKGVDLSAWNVSLPIRDEWRQMFIEAWRLERDYFYDPAMHGVDWKAVQAKYLPLVDRVSTRAELSDLVAQMVGELSALHIFVRGGDARQGTDRIAPANLGARLERDQQAGGYRVAHVYQTDPDEPERASPLARPESTVAEGEVITAINGIATLSTADVGMLLRQQAGRQVLLRVKAATGVERDVIVKPISSFEANDLRYHEWEYTRRQLVEKLSGGRIGYVHLRAMGNDNYTEWAKGYYPAFNREGFIVDVRHNRGGNIDSWILSRLLRKPWFRWSQRVGDSPNWNMQYAFPGHVAVLCNEQTASDGEAFAEGIKRLNIGKVIGTRTWGGEIWLSSSNTLVDNGIATAAEFGVYGPEGQWLVEGHGVEPDMTVDNLPHATFNGDDAQLKAAVDYLLKQMQEKPVKLTPRPAYPDKSFKGK